MIDSKGSGSWAVSVVPSESWGTSLRPRPVGWRSGSRNPSAMVVEVAAPRLHDRSCLDGISQLVAGQNFSFQAGEEWLLGGIIKHDLTLPMD